MDGVLNAVVPQKKRGRPKGSFDAKPRKPYVSKKATQQAPEFVGPRRPVGRPKGVAGKKGARFEWVAKYDCQCKQCSVEFVSKKPFTKFCGDTCRVDYYNEQQRLRNQKASHEKRKEVIKCGCCGSLFCALTLGLKPKFCTKNCSDKADYREKKKTGCLSLFKSQMRVLVCHALARKGYKKGTKTEDVLGCSFSELRSHIEKQFRPGMSWENRSAWHIDHIIPMASAQSVEDALRLNHYSNLQPLWAEENIRKGDKIVSLI